MGLPVLGDLATMAGEEHRAPDATIRGGAVRGSRTATAATISPSATAIDRDQLRLGARVARRRRRNATVSPTNTPGSNVRPGRRLRDRGRASGDSRNALRGLRDVESVPLARDTSFSPGLNTA